MITWLEREGVPGKRAAPYAQVRSMMLEVASKKRSFVFPKFFFNFASLCAVDETSSFV